MSSQNANESASRIVEIDGDVVNEIIREGARNALLDFEPSDREAHGEAAIAHVLKRYDINLQMSIRNDPHDFGRRGVMSFMNARTGRPPFSGMEGPSNVVPLRSRTTAPPKLRLINGNQLRATTKVAPWFYVDGVIQGRKVSLLMGEDGSGKSFLMLLLAIATATGGDWLGFKVKQGPVIFLTAEEEKQDVWERIEAIEKMLGRGNLDLKDFHLVAIDESEDSDDSLVLGEPERVGIKMTELWDSLVLEVGRIKPVAVMLDPLVEIFDGDEMVRVQARQFITPMRKLARKHNLAVYVAGHPSKTSAREKTGTAGTTGWSATMRGRQFYEIVYGDDGHDTGERKFHVKKVTGGKAGIVVEVKLNENGVPVLKNAPAVVGEPVDETAFFAEQEREKQDFMATIERNFEIGVFLAPGPTKRNYAPKAIVADEGGKDRTTRISAYKRIMDDLIYEKRIVSEQYGTRRDDKWRLKVVSRAVPDRSEEENCEDEQG